MSFERLIEGDTIQIIASKDFTLSTKVSVLNSKEALRLLSSKRITRITSAENKDGNIIITSHYCTCPHCGKRFSAYIKNSHKQRPHLTEEIAGLCDNELSLFPKKAPKKLWFSQPKKIGVLTWCPHCELEGVISNETMNCIITFKQNHLIVTRGSLTISDIMNMYWLSNNVLSFDDADIYETIDFDFLSGTVTVSIQCGNKTLCAKPIVSKKALGEEDPWLLMYTNSRITREIKHSFGMICGDLPFSDKLLTIDTLVLLTKFIGYPAEFYHYLPLSIDDETKLIPEEFEHNCNKLHYYHDVPKFFSEINIPKTKSIKRIIFNRPSFLIYREELERLWNIIENIDLYRKQLTSKTVFTLLAYFHMYTGIDEFLISLRNTKGIVWLQKAMDSQLFRILCSLGIEYLSSNSHIRQKLLKIHYSDESLDYLGNQYYFSFPIHLYSERNAVYWESGFQFVRLNTTKDYYIAGKLMNNCLGSYSAYNNSQVYIMRRSSIELAAIEIINNRIIQAFGKNNKMITSEQLQNVIKIWAKKNSYIIENKYPYNLGFQ